ncbi:OmpH family outer membrane protein [Solemya velesiana gill symbiont]|uniref:OmpH family outer membrane protein n=1 Tax=Solemya velesiana gill symbiont TaxID=1918948 RepID=UPI001FE30623|nr:OmpH family outer membrane protein [Solemya velesiana gill symbiont]
MNINYLLAKSPQNNAASKKLDAEFKSRNNDLVGKQKKLKTLEEKLERDSAVMSADEAKRLEQDIRSRKRQLKNSRDEFREDLNLRRSEETNKLLKYISEVINQVAEERKLDLVLSNVPGVVYASKRLDITEDVLDKLNAQATSGGSK